MKLIRLEQRRVLNADFAFTAQAGLTLSHVDGDLTVREVSNHIEFDLTGSIWSGSETSGIVTVDNAVAHHSILSVDTSDLSLLTAGVSISAADHTHNVTLDTQSAALDLQLMSGPLTIENFGQVNQVGSNNVHVADVSVSADTSIELRNFSGHDISLTASEIDFTGGANSVSGATLSILPGSASAIELGGLTDHAGVLDFTDTDIAALHGGFQSLNFGTASALGDTPISVHSSGASFGDAVTLNSAGTHGSITISGQLDSLADANSAAVTLNGFTTLSGDIVTHGGAIQINGSLRVDGTHSLDTTDADATAAGSITITGIIDGANHNGSDTLTLDAAHGNVDGTDDADVSLQSHEPGHDLAALTVFGQSVDFSDIRAGHVNVTGVDVDFHGTTSLEGGDLTATATEHLDVSGTIV
ncbi:MAG TPA: hypothetical protein VK137_12660, partial [Planctomycetaceae bacterium]|nr:hypothetical protein [Planctomycetaceae bacterium]